MLITVGFYWEFIVASFIQLLTLQPIYSFLIKTNPYCGNSSRLASFWQSPKETDTNDHQKLLSPSVHSFRSSVFLPGSIPEVKDSRALSEFDSIDSWTKIEQYVFFHRGPLSQYQLKVISLDEFMRTCKHGCLSISIEEVELSFYLFGWSLLILSTPEYYIWEEKVLI